MQRTHVGPGTTATKKRTSATLRGAQSGTDGEGIAARCGQFNSFIAAGHQRWCELLQRTV